MYNNMYYIIYNTIKLSKNVKVITKSRQVNLRINNVLPKSIEPCTSVWEQSQDPLVYTILVQHPTT